MAVGNMTDQTPNPTTQMLTAIEELKTEIKTLRADLKRLEGSILKERIKAVEEALTQNRRLLHADQLQEELNDDLQKITNPQCKNQPSCIKKFTEIATENLQAIKNSNPAIAIADFDSKIDNAGQIAEKAKGAPCEACHLNFQKKLRREKRAFQTVVLVEKPSDGKQDKELNVTHLVEAVLEPLANSARLKILLSTYEGKKSFSRLTQITSLKGGHLIFHLKKLLDAGLIAQEDNKGDYLITQKGIDIAKKISLLQT